MKTLIRAFDEYKPYINAIVPLTLGIDKVIYIYHHDIQKSRIDALQKILKRYSDIDAEYIRLKNDHVEMDAILEKYPDIIIDLSASRYLSILLMDKVLHHDNTIIYYSEEDDCIKSYREHKILEDRMFSFTVSDLITLNGGRVMNSMHAYAKKEETRKIIREVVEASATSYQTFVSFVSRIGSSIAHKAVSDRRYKIGADAVSKIRSDDTYRRYRDFGMFTLDEEYLTFANEEVAAMFGVAGSFLENYIYMKLTDSGYFDEVIMSAVIDFSGYERRYPIVCEIDCIVLKNNHLLFTSCKSNKVDTTDLNEIKVHNMMFGNYHSSPVICTLDDLNEKSPSVYAKGRELDVAIIDRTAFENGELPELFRSIIEGTYTYENLPD